MKPFRVRIVNVIWKGVSTHTRPEERPDWQRS